MKSNSNFANCKHWFRHVVKLLILHLGDSVMFSPLNIKTIRIKFVCLRVFINTRCNLGDYMDFSNGSV